MKRGMLAAVLAGAMLLGGCGGSSTDSPAATEAAAQMQVLYDKEQKTKLKKLKTERNVAWATVLFLALSTAKK